MQLFRTRYRKLEKHPIKLTKTFHKGDLRIIMAMTKRDKERRDNMIYRLLELSHNKGIDINFFEMAKLVDTLHRYESTLHTIGERYCNDDMSEHEQKRIETKETNTEKRVKELLSSIGINHVTFSGDPRGCMIKMILYEDRPYDEYVINW